MNVSIKTNTGVAIEESGEGYEQLREAVYAQIPEGDYALYVKVDRP